MATGEGKTLAGAIAAAGYALGGRSSGNIALLPFLSHALLEISGTFSRLLQRDLSVVQG